MIVAIDIETDGLRPDAEILGVGYYYDCQGSKVGYIAAKDATFSMKDAEYCFHNGKFDVTRLWRQGCKTARIDHDTIIMASLLNVAELDSKGDRRLGLKALSEKCIGFPDWSIDTKHIKDIDKQVVADYCMQDCKATWLLYHVFEEMLKKEGLWNYYIKRAMPLCRYIAEVEYRGVKLDMVALREETQKAGYEAGLSYLGVTKGHRELIREVEKELLDEAILKVETRGIEKFNQKVEELETKEFSPPKSLEGELQKVKTRIHASVDRKVAKLNDSPLKINLKSSKQMQLLFKKVLGELPRERPSEEHPEGKETVSGKLLQHSAYKYPIIKDYLTYKNNIKRVQDLLKWKTDQYNGRLHGSFNLHTVRTGRLSSSDPNLQQINRALRRIFVADGVFLIADYSNIEPRLAAHFSQDVELLDIFIKNKDLYGEVAVKLFNLPCKGGEVKAQFKKRRDNAKTIVLGILYGMGYMALAQRLTLEDNTPTSPQEAQEFIKGFWKMFPPLRRYKYDLGALATSKGYVEGWFGRKLWLPREEAVHKAFNYRIQNAASELTALSQVRCKEEAEKYGTLLMFVHDEVVYDCPTQEDAESLKQVLQKFMVDDIVLSVPLAIECSIGKTWAEKG